MRSHETNNTEQTRISESRLHFENNLENIEITYFRQKLFIYCWTA